MFKTTKNAPLLFQCVDVDRGRMHSMSWTQSWSSWSRRTNWWAYPRSTNVYIVLGASCIWHICKCTCKSMISIGRSKELRGVLTAYHKARTPCHWPSEWTNALPPIPPLRRIDRRKPWSDYCARNEATRKDGWKWGIDVPLELDSWLGSSCWSNLCAFRCAWDHAKPRAAWFDAKYHQPIMMVPAWGFGTGFLEKIHVSY